MSELLYQSDKLVRRWKPIVSLVAIPLIVLPFILIQYRVAPLADGVAWIKTTSDHQRPRHRDEARAELDSLPWHPLQGQQLYVPAYSQVYPQLGIPNRFTVTLHVRNTDVNDAIVVMAVRYFDASGTELRTMLEKPLRLGPLAATDFVIERNDKPSRRAASFLVEWTAGTTVTPPVVETVVIGDCTTLRSPAVVLDETLPFDSVHGDNQ